MDNCLICDKPLDPELATIQTYKAIAVQTIRNASKQRKDDKHLKLKNVTSIELHKSCFDVYIRESSIKAALIKKPQKRRKNSEPAIVNFDFHLKCFFCGEDASDSFIKKLATSRKKYKTVRIVTKDTTKISITNRYNKLENPSDYMKSVLARIENVSLHEIKARYHNDCMVRFFSPQSNSNVRGRPVGETMICVIDFIRKYVSEHKNQGQFSLKKLIEMCPGSDKPDIRNLKDRLEEYFGSKSVILDGDKGDYNLIFVDSINENTSQTTNGSSPPSKKRRLQNEIVWSINPSPKLDDDLPYIKSCEPVLKCTPTTPLEAWSLLFPDELLNLILTDTNAYIKSKNRAEFPAHQKETELTELKAVIGLLYYVGLYRVNNFDWKYLWEPHGPSRFRLTMTLKRFKFLIESLRFNEEAVWSDFLKNCSDFYDPSNECTIVDTGESVYLIDAKSGYIVNMYAGDKDIDVKKLTEPIHGLGVLGFTVTCGKKFTSVVSFEKIKDECGLCMVGEIEKTEVPEEFQNGQMFGYHKGKTLISYEDVVLLSTRDDSDKIDKKTQVPEIIQFYKKTTETAEKFNDSVFEFTTIRKTNNNSSLKHLYSMLDVANHNCFILYSLLASNKLIKPRYEFITKLVLNLTHNLMRQRTLKRGLNLCLRLQIQEYLDSHEWPPDHDVKDEIPDSKMDQRKLCNYCPENLNRKTWYMCVQCLRPMCYGHQSKLCETCGDFRDEDI